jgi:RNA polymerase sigma-70 factor (ECF subfamily)
VNRDLSRKSAGSHYNTNGGIPNFDYVLSELFVNSAVESDADLLARFRAGDDTALGQLFDRYEGPVFRFLIGLLRDRHKAEDALQDTFVQVLRFADVADPATFRGWLFTVAHRQAALLKRKEKRLPIPVGADALFGLMDGEDGPEASAKQMDDARLLEELLAALPATQQTVIRMRIYDGLKFREVAERLGCPLNTALARMHDGLKALRQLWEVRHA